jgi:hypothetical protein
VSGFLKERNPSFPAKASHKHPMDKDDCFPATFLHSSILSSNKQTKQQTKHQLTTRTPPPEKGTREKTKKKNFFLSLLENNSGKWALFHHQRKRDHHFTFHPNPLYNASSPESQINLAISFLTSFTTFNLMPTRVHACIASFVALI